MVERVYYKDPYLREIDAKIVDVRKEKDRVEVVLDRTIFYPEGGGQPGDRGVIKGNDFEIMVEDTIEKNGEIFHIGKLRGEIPKEGEKVKLYLDWEWRYGNMQMHTGQHILSAVLKKLYDLDTTGFNIFRDYAKIEVNGEVNWDMIERAELEVNKIIINDLPVVIEEYDKLPEEIALKLRKNVTKVKEKIRIVKIGDVDVTPCGGTHVKSTREVGIIKVLRFYKKSKNLWRIEFTCGYRAISKMNEILRDYWGSLDLMPNKNPPLIERINEVLRTVNSLENRIEELRREIWEWKGKALLKEGVKVGNYTVITHVENWNMKDAQAFAIDFVKKNSNTILLLANEKYVLFAKNEGVPVSMRELLKEVIDELGGKGGGTDNLARGRVEAKPEEIFDVALEKLRSHLQV